MTPTALASSTSCTRLPPALPFECVRISGNSLESFWLDQDCLTHDVALILHGVDQHVAHTAIRHIREFPISHYKVFVPHNHQ
jgi:hypothetical protein